MANSLRQKMRKQRKNLEKRHQESIDRKDTSIFGSIFNKAKVPENVSFWKCGSGKHIIDILPFVAGPNVPNKNVDEGDVEYVIDVWVHRNVGPKEDSFVCPTRTWGEPCPICEDLKENEYDEEYVKGMRSKRQSVYLVWVHDSAKEEEEGIKIFNTAHFFMQNHLDELAEIPRGGGVIIFSDLDEGKSVAFTRKGTGAGNTQFLGHKFVDRPEPIPDDIVDQIFSLDECIDMRPTYDEMADSYFGKEEKDEEVESEPEENDDVPMFSSKDAPPEEPPDLDIEIPPEETGTIDDCPAGALFGIDTDSLPDCKNCEVWEACAEERGRAEREARMADRKKETVKAKPKPKPKSKENTDKDVKKDAEKATSRTTRRVARRKPSRSSK